MLFNFLKSPDINKGFEEFRNTAGAALLDVRTSQEYADGHLPKSLNIDIDKISTALLEIKDKSVPIFVYCYSGARSAQAVNALRNAGYINAENIGGISSYTGEIEIGGK